MVVLADVPYIEICSKISFPAVLPWQKKNYYFHVPGPKNQNEGTFVKTALLRSRPLVPSQESVHQEVDDVLVGQAYLSKKGPFAKKTAKICLVSGHFPQEMGPEFGVRLCLFL